MVFNKSLTFHLMEGQNSYIIQIDHTHNIKYRSVSNALTFRDCLETLGIFNYNRFYSEDPIFYTVVLFRISGLFTCRPAPRPPPSCDSSGVTCGCARLIKDCDNRRNRIPVSMVTSSTYKYFPSQILFKKIRVVFFFVCFKVYNVVPTGGAPTLIPGELRGLK